ncbi:putative E3 ubiquitin-protein ligase UBR7 isoform X1 [Bombus terrestris]|uniref:E3 ubiquitin-protein ligase UBR7 isoform X1 n=1 Tax=Bombus terrestris TaxID=30195 RepID=A0A9B2JNF8_BOMTE|nr:putative E3 ubiquitin-protein ligase UBR7 isoform X1 [Bombus terrestris]XP_012165059.1 putative E3 ubiquitin-protein ligase UBR7 isoform X1 [Bombus terrestris]XP_012165061.1 putative E3 ubiquitin-protein ligase UBR7 isoform X1 [Bombus terrestris]XP_012165062.1 putative E3 ubiquitin-protein ligase UBR7 isoform X1 [Bombus terrestris]XP_048263248.1 putative E3 ubiquitin-protein ligase UBR7 isoform X1 [Bombus terrestris]XP_048263249.1 putative E3 ubiquitin-protein ligase UBR7 isoform X1 [Bombus
MSENIEEIIEEENSVTMLDVLREENQLEEDAYAVLGASDDKNCTYSKGYTRQALYACKTCCQKSVRAAVCLACSFHCHEGHELVELYTKRHFRCDCGNSKFGGKKCNLDPSKDLLNSENQYNHNFDGLYCICQRPYPDPDDTVNDEMLQCIICEDWYHSKHLECEKEMPADDAYDEMICAGCMKKNDFLWNYANKHTALTTTEVSFVDKEEELIDVESESKSCRMPRNNSAKRIVSRGSCFWIEGWRAALCTCETCKELYREKHIAFLLDPTDSVHAYEEAGKINSRESRYEKGMKALASLGRVEQLTAIEEYNNMKERLKQYLQKFAENKKVVREEDIKEFFSEMESKKRPKVVIPTYCR